MVTSGPATTADLPGGSLLTQKTLVDTIYRAIRGRIARGEIGSGDRILDHAVAAEFACTRTPVRQALLHLVTESFLVGTTRGFVVPRLDASDVREIFELRRMLEPPAAASVALAMPDERLGMLRSTLVQTQSAAQADDFHAVLRGTIAFRAIWLETVQSRRLRETIQTFADHAQQVRLQTLRRTAGMEDAIACLGELLEAFERHDAAAASAATVKSLRLAEQHYSAARPY